MSGLFGIPDGETLWGIEEPTEARSPWEAPNNAADSDLDGLLGTQPESENSILDLDNSHEWNLTQNDNAEPLLTLEDEEAADASTNIDALFGNSSERDNESLNLDASFEDEWNVTPSAEDNESLDLDTSNEWDLIQNSDNSESLLTLEDEEVAESANQNIDALFGNSLAPDSESLDIGASFEDEWNVTPSAQDNESLDLGASFGDEWNLTQNDDAQSLLTLEDEEVAESANQNIDALFGNSLTPDNESLDLGASFEDEWNVTPSAEDNESLDLGASFEDEWNLAQDDAESLLTIESEEIPQSAVTNLEALFDTDSELENSSLDFDASSMWDSSSEEWNVAQNELDDTDSLLTLEDEDIAESSAGWADINGTNWLTEDEQSAGADDWSLETAEEDDRSLAAAFAPDDGFGELEAFLDESSEPAIALRDEFDELEAFLGEDDSSPALAMDGGDEFDELEALLGEKADATAEELRIPGDEFDELEALLGEDSLETVGRKGREKETVGASRQGRSQAQPVEDEFGDLEKLLLLADENMGGPPTVASNKLARPNVRRPGWKGGYEQMMKVPVKHLDNLSNLVGELVVNRNSLEQDQERLRQFLDNLLHQVQQLSDVGARMQDLYERSLLESSLLASRQSYRSSRPDERGRTNASSSGGGQADTHATGMAFDALEMDKFTGFHLLSQEMIELIVRVRESASDIEFLVDETDQVARMLRQITTQLQEGLTRARMVPFANTADRLPRAVREISLKCGKEAELYIEGRETLLDKVLQDHLYDPMTHLVNNAITHGIEPPDVRQRAGKSPIGRITIRAFHQGNQTVISVSDDGAGIDPERVKAKAIEKGLIGAAEAKTMSRLDVYDLLFHPGFSTKDKADDFSGRGVGMDVVRTSLTEIRGTIITDSTIGKGTTFTIRLPLTLSICKALCCLSNKARIAFPMDGVEDMMDVPNDRIQTNAEGQTCIPWRDSLLPFQPLGQLLTYNRQIGRGGVYGGQREDDMISIVVLRSAGSFIAIEIDQVIGEQEIVIKQLEGPVPKPVGVAGATVLGDGRIMPIADVLELIDISLGRTRADSGMWKDSVPVVPEVAAVKQDPMVLIVDDSITVRELLSLTFNKAGYRVEQARDGQEAWDKLRSGLPCQIVFCDIEMPRMDGLELLSRIQKEESLNHLPVAMLTSRGADRHRQMAAQLGASGYFTKPYLEEALLDAAQRMMRGEVLLTASTNA
ncbi:response regulator [Microcoleus sp. FACHB-831]|nr:response regulator [Microcoleus sp. FACHB-831]